MQPPDLGSRDPSSPTSPSRIPHSTLASTQTRPSGRRRVGLAYRLLLRLYPRAFRRAYGAELTETFAAQRDEPRYRGPAGRLLFWRDILADLVASAARLRTAALAHRIDLRRQRRVIDAALARTRLPDERSLLDVMLHDLRYSLRLLARRPGFTAVAVLSLALGLGGISTIFGLVDGLVLKPFHLPDPDRLVTVGVSFPKLNSSEDRFIEVLSPAEYLDIRGLRTLTRVQAFDLGNRHVSGGDQPERLFTALVFGDLFETVGLKAHLGRGFTAEELAPGGRPAAVISHRVWRSRFGGDPALVGRAIRVNGVATNVVGVMPRELLVLGTDLWLPLRADPATEWPRNARQFSILGRIAPGASLAQVNAELAVLASTTATAFRGQFKEYEGWRLIAAPWASALTHSLQPTAYLLLGAIAFVLLIICVNIANLQLARATTRQREMAVRVALGAGHWRVGRQLLTESLLLAAAGCGLGVLFAFVGLRASRLLLPAQLLALDPRVELSGRVLLVSVVTSMVAGVLVGVLPALRAMRADPFDSLKGESRLATASAGTHRLRYGLIVSEVALAMILLAGAGLLARTMLHLSRVHPGIDTHNVLTMRLTLPVEKHRGKEAIVAFFDQLVERVRALPGVRDVAAASQYPPGVVFRGQMRVEGRVLAAGESLPVIDGTIASPSLFKTLGIPLRAGRTLTQEDSERAPLVAIVNESFVRAFYQGTTPIGRRIGTRGDPKQPWRTIVGVVGDTRGRGLMREPRAEVYVPLRQMEGAWNQLFLLVRTEGDPHAMLPSVRREIMAIDRDQPAYDIRTLDEAFAESVFVQRALMVLLGVFAGLAVTLAAIGIYAVMSYAVTARTQEIGIRIALGADRGSVIGMVVRQVLWLVAIGVALGAAGAVALGRLATSVLAGTNATDPLTLTVVALLLASVALLAGYLPARRASRIDPVVALRME
jgi:putative ABC transport system permease protein